MASDRELVHRNDGVMVTREIEDESVPRVDEAHATTDRRHHPAPAPPPIRLRAPSSWLLRRSR